MAKKSNTYLIRQGFRNIAANPLMSFASVGVLFACLLLVGGAVLLYLNIQKTINYVGSQSEIVLYVQDGVSEANCRQFILPKLEQTDGISDVTFVSSSEGMKEMEAQIEGGEELFSLFNGEDILPHSFRVKVTDPSRYDEMVTALSAIDGIGEVSANGKIANTLTNISHAVATFGIIVVSVLMAASIFILNNTVRLGMFSRRREIYIMKMVGATDSFVRVPFFIETVTLGLVSALLAFVAVRLAYVGLSDYLAEISVDAVAWSALGWKVFLSFIAAGFLVGLLSATMSIRKYLEV